MIPQVATHRSVREAIEAAAERGEITMLEATATMSVGAAEQLAAQVVFQQKISNVRLYTKGPWLHVEPLEARPSERSGH